MTDELIIFAYKSQVRCDPDLAPDYFGALIAIDADGSVHTGADLSAAVVMERRGGGPILLAG